MSRPVYLDYNATTPVDPRVVEAMLPFLHMHYGNPSSEHAYGHAAKAAVDQARAEVAALIGARPEEIVFTGCATEANNLALLGVARALASGSRRTLIYSAIEHPSVAQPIAPTGRHRLVYKRDSGGCNRAHRCQRAANRQRRRPGFGHAGQQ